MKISRTSAKGLKQEYSVVVPSADMETKIHERLTIIGKKVKMPGFRPGMIPSTILKQRYGADAMQDALENVVNSAVKQISKENEIRQASQPKVSVDTFDEGKDVEEPGAYTVNGVPYCCGKPLKEVDNTFICEVCGAEYEGE